MAMYDVSRYVPCGSIFAITIPEWTHHNALVFIGLRILLMHADRRKRIKKTHQNMYATEFLVVVWGREEINIWLKYYLYLFGEPLALIWNMGLVSESLMDRMMDKVLIRVQFIQFSYGTLKRQQALHSTSTVLYGLLRGDTVKSRKHFILFPSK